MEGDGGGDGRRDAAAGASSRNRYFPHLFGVGQRYVSVSDGLDVELQFASSNQKSVEGVAEQFRDSVDKNGGF